MVGVMTLMGARIGLEGQDRSASTSRARKTLLRMASHSRKGFGLMRRVCDLVHSFWANQSKTDITPGFRRLH